MATNPFHEMRLLPPGRALVLAGLLLAGVLLTGGCDPDRNPPPQAQDDSMVKLETPQTGQTLAAGDSAEYRFHAARRGAYLIIVEDNPDDQPLVIQHPKKSCTIRGNGSCELVSGPEENYDVRIVSGSGKPVAFTLLITHSEGKGRFEGGATVPVGLPLENTHSGRVGVGEASYYTFTSGGGGVHTISLSGGRSDLAWRLFNRAAFDVILQECDGRGGAGVEACQTAPLAPNTHYYLKVQEMSGVPGDYDLRILPP